MKEKIYTLIKDYTKSHREIKIIEEKDLIIIYNSNREPSDFYHFIFMNENDFLKKEYNFKEIYETIKQDNLNQFNKNLNFIYFVKTNEPSEEIKKIAYEMEENPYYARKRVVFYQKEILKKIDNLDFREVDLKNLDGETSLKLDIFTGLTFLPLQIEDKSNNSNSLFQSIFHANKYFEFEGTKGELFGEEENFRNNIQKLNNEIDAQVNAEKLSKFEEKLIELFSHSEELKNYLFSKSIKYEEN